MLITKRILRGTLSVSWKAPRRMAGLMSTWSGSTGRTDTATLASNPSTNFASTYDDPPIQPIGAWRKIGTVHDFDIREVLWLRRHATVGLHAAFSAAVKAWMDRQDECTIGGISTSALSQAGQSSRSLLPGEVVTPTRSTERQGDARVRCPGAEIHLLSPPLPPCVSSAVPGSVPHAPVLEGEAATVGDMASAIAELRAELAARPVLQLRDDWGGRAIDVMRPSSQKGCTLLPGAKRLMRIGKMANEGLLEYVHGQLEDAIVGRLSHHVWMTFCARFEKPTKHSWWRGRDCASGSGY